MLFRPTLILLCLVALVALSGCGDVNTAQVSTGPGFWSGWWDGMTAPWAFAGNLLGIGDWGIYTTANNGGWYDFGFLIGIGAYASPAMRTRL